MTLEGLFYIGAALAIIARIVWPYLPTVRLPRRAAVVSLLPLNLPQARVKQPLAPIAPAPQVSSIPPLTHMPIVERGHVVIAGRQGDGKTQTSITLLLADVAREAQVYWLNPHATLYHPQDQRTDLRPIADRFTLVRDYAGIVATLKAAYALVTDVRLPLYAVGKDVGHTIVLYLDEWPAIHDSTDGEAARLVKMLLRESRKCNVWLVLATQDAQVETIGVKGGVRAAFNTRLVGNVDSATWRALAGDAPTQPLTWGAWYAARAQSSGVLTWHPYTSVDVVNLAQRGEWPTFAPLVASDDGANRLLEQALGVHTGMEKLQETASNEAEKLDTSKTVFSATQSVFDISGLTFDASEIAKIAARIARGEKKTDVVTAMPRYASRQHARYAAAYDCIRDMVENA